MSLDKRPASIEIVFNDTGTQVKGISLKSHLFFEGQFMRTTDPEPVSGIDDPLIQEIATVISSGLFEEKEAAVAHSQGLASDLSKAINQLDELRSKLDDRTVRLAAAENELERLRTATNAFLKAIQA